MAINFPEGIQSLPSKIVQVVQATSTTKTTVAASSFTTTGLEVTITPTSSTSKVLILSSFFFGQIKSVNANQDNMKYVNKDKTM